MAIDTEINSLLDAHDVRFLSPIEEGRFALPVGNGDLGAMIWTPADRLQITVNKSNAWDDMDATPVDDFHWSPRTEEKSTGLVSCASLTFENNMPLYQHLYLDDFEARLHLSEGVVAIDARSPLYTSNIKTFIGREPNVLVVDITDLTTEAVERTLTLARWGSRRMFHWFAQVIPDTTIGLGGTRAGCDETTLWVEQKLRRITFAVVARFVGAPVQTEKVNSHTVRFVLQAAKQVHGQLYLAVVTSEDHPEPLAEARRRVEQAERDGLEKLARANGEHWADFWSRSYVRFPDPYLENLYYFSRYQAGASSSGAYPPMHHGGIWMWNHDVGNWGSYYHWNEQQMVWPLHTAGHPELAKGYLDWRFKSLPYACETARKIHGIEGAFFTDISDRDGRQAANGKSESHLNHNLTPASQIAMDFWCHYQYGGDLNFLRERAYPMMTEAARFYANYLVQDEHGVFHVPASTGYEGHLQVRDCAADLAMIKTSFAALLQASALLDVEDDFTAHIREILEHLVDFSIVDEKGQPVLATGIAIKDEPNRSYEVGRPYQKDEVLFYQGFWMSMAPAFPSGAIGLSQQGTPLFEATCNAVRLLGPTSAGGWIPSSAFASRLGMGKEAFEMLAWYVNHCQLFPQGFMQEGQYHNGSSDIWTADEPYLIRDQLRTTEKTRLFSRFHDIPAPECNTNFMTIVQEMMLQSYDGIIRAFPALPDEWREVKFHLHAVGGFEVTAEMTHHTVSYIRIKSILGNICRVEPPWKGWHVTVLNESTGEQVYCDSHLLIEFPTQPGESYIVRLAGAVQQNKPIGTAKLDLPEPGPRQAYGRKLGIQRHF